MRSWEQAYLAGECNEIQSKFWNPKPTEELYDTENDPWEINNLANDPAYKDVLERMRTACTEWSLKIKDTGFIPEAERSDRSKELASYDYFRNGNFDLKPIIEAANLAIDGNPDKLDQLCEFLKNEDSAIRYWGATGLLILGDQAKTRITEIQETCEDESTNVATVAAEALYKLGNKKMAKKALLNGLKDPNPFARTHVLNAIDCIEDDSEEIKKGVIELLKNYDTIDRQKYDVRAAKRLIEKWDIDPSNYKIEFSW